MWSPPGVLDAAVLPDRDPLPRWLAPLPRRLEDAGLRAAPLIVLVNLVGTAFGFWYYGIHPFSEPVVVWQFGAEPLVMWPFVPDSPGGTLFIALALGAWALGRNSEYLNALAFFGCLKLGFWTPFVLALFFEGFIEVGWPMYAFLFCSHLGMVLEAFLLHRISEFPVRAVGVAVGWYGLNDLVDYFVPVVGTPHHTLLPVQVVVDGAATHPTVPHLQAAAGAVVLTLAATFLALSTRVRKLEAGAIDPAPPGAAAARSEPTPEDTDP